MEVDQISLSDLELFDDPDGRGGVIGLLRTTETPMGRAALARRLRNPLTDVDEIRSTQAAVRFLSEEWSHPLVRPRLAESTRRYLSSNIDLGDGSSGLRDLARIPWLRIREDELCRELVDGVQAAAEFVEHCGQLGRSLASMSLPEGVAVLAQALVEGASRLASVGRPSSLYHCMRADRVLRLGTGRPVSRLLELIGELDALRTMGVSSRDLGWTYPEVVEADSFVFQAEGLFHPFLADGRANPARIVGGEPIVFLTGPNMAGKTTYMRAVGLTVLLGQVGMGVPASQVRMTPVDVLLTSLNPSDNLRAGLSFFFAEVMRVKEAASHLAEGRRCLVLFDEVFKGTNVKDALDASLAVISAFSRASGSGCVFSSHLSELAGPLRSGGRVRFCHFDGTVVDGRATYSYALREGVSEQRLGIQLLEEANVPVLLARIGRTDPAA